MPPQTKLTHPRRSEGGDASPSSSVQALETNVDSSIPQQSRYQIRLHGRWNEERDNVFAALATSDDQNHQRRGFRIQGCGSLPMLYISGEGQVVVGARCCKDRLCPLCNARRSDAASSRIGWCVQHMKSCRFATFTIAQGNRTLPQLIDHLFDSFRRVRQQDIWKRRVSGGVGTMEIKLSSRTGGWHVHLHVLMDGDFFEHKMLKAAWEKATGDSTIVHIKATHDRERPARYLCKYIGKPAELKNLHPGLIRDYADATHRRRFMVTFGSFRKTSLECAKDLEPPAPMAVVASVEAISDWARQGWPRARRAVGLLWRAIERQMEACYCWKPAIPDLGEPLSAREHQLLLFDLRYLGACMTGAKEPSSPCTDPPQEPCPVLRVLGQIDLLDVAPQASPAAIFST